jgi:hypothetical protein
MNDIQEHFVRRTLIDFVGPPLQCFDLFGIWLFVKHPSD